MTRKQFLVIMLDVKRPFNSVSWKTILSCLKKNNVPSYLARTMSNYLGSSKMTCGGISLPITAGITIINNPWFPNLTECAELPAYSDDLAITIDARIESEVELIANHALETLPLSMVRDALSLALSPSPPRSHTARLQDK